MANEFNDIKAKNSSLTSSYRPSSEYNEIKTNNGTIFADINEIALKDTRSASDTKTTTTITKASSTILKTVMTSFVALTATVTLGTNILSGTKTVVSDITTTNEENILYVEVEFSDIDQEEDLVLTITNDFTNREYPIETELNTDTNKYIYFQEVKDLKYSMTYIIKVRSGTETLYSKTVTMPKEIDSVYEDNINIVSYFETIYSYDIKMNEEELDHEKEI